MIVHCDTTRFIYDVMEQGEYKYLFDHLVVIDVGCNIGTFSMWIYDQCDQIHAVDVSIENIDNLKKNIKDNHLDKIRPYCCAIAGKTGTRMAGDSTAPGDGGWRLDEAGINAVDAYSLKDFMDNNHIGRADVLKLDVEGAEYEVLQVKDFPKERINTIIGEFHKESLRDILENLGYSYEEFGNKFIARR